MSSHRYGLGPHQPSWALRRSNLHLGEPNLLLHQQQQQHQQQDQLQQPAEPEYSPWPIPNHDIMADRWQHRHHVLGETAAHLLVHPHGGLGVTGRNVLHVLHDRQVRGPSAITCRAHWQRSHNLGVVHQNANLHHQNNSNNTNADGMEEQEQDQDSDKEEDNSSDNRRGSESNMPRSPSTVLLETSGTEPMETATTTTTTISNSTTAYSTVAQVSEQQHDDAHPEDQTHQPPPFFQDPVLSEYILQKNNNSVNTNSRFLPYPMTVSRELRTFGEYAAATKYHSAFLTHLGGDEDTLQHRPASSRAVSTISVAFSPDGRTLASTHGDHTVKISCCETGRLCQSLEGHPRTPWTVKYHPTNADVVASGCLGHQVRVWNWREKICLQMVRLEFAIISLAFHPTGHLLAIANGTRLHFWGVGKNVDKTKGKNINDTTENNTNTSNNTLLLLEMDHRHMLRCVHFPPGGDTLIIGGVNQENDPRRRRPGSNGMSFYLRLWDFDLERTLAGSLMMMMSHNSGNGAAQVMPRGAISNPRTFVPRALLYNDGGFDVSPDGKILCACAEYWLPEGVDSAMELLVKEEEAYDAEIREQEMRQPQLPSPSAAAAAATTIDAAPPLPQSWGGAMTQSSLSASDTKSAVSVALASLRGIVDANVATHGRSGSFREGMDQLFQQQNAGNAPPPRTPTAMDSSPDRFSGAIPRTPPVTSETRLRNLSPPPPPGNRFGGTVSTSGGQPLPTQQPYFRQTAGGTNARGISSPPPPPPVPPQTIPPGIAVRPPNPLSLVLSSIPPNNSSQSTELYSRGRYVPHVVTVSLDTSRVPDDVRYIDENSSKVKSPAPCAVARGHRPRLGQLMEAHPLDASKAGAVTCVKFSPSTDFCLIGYGVREPIIEGTGSFHPVTAVFRVRGGMTHVSTTLSGDDDVNIARFHPDSGHSFVYGTKQGRVRMLSPRPWNFYYNSSSQPNSGG